MASSAVIRQLPDAEEKASVASGETFHLPSDREIAELYAVYAAQPSVPFFIDIAGPTPVLTYEQFADYCCSDDTRIWVCREPANLSFFMLSDLQPGLALANLEFWFQRAAPDRLTLLEFWRSVEAAMDSLHITRVQCLLLAKERAKATILEAAGFQHEGTLRQHFYHQGKYHDLLVLSKVTNGRR